MNCFSHLIYWNRREVQTKTQFKLKCLYLENRKWQFILINTETWLWNQHLIYAPPVGEDIRHWWAMRSSTPVCAHCLNHEPSSLCKIREDIQSKGQNAKKYWLSLVLVIEVLFPPSYFCYDYLGVMLRINR